MPVKTAKQAISEQWGLYYDRKDKTFLVKRSLMILRMNYKMQYNSKDKDFGEERCMLDCSELRDKWRKYSIAELRELGSEKEKMIVWKEEGTLKELIIFLSFPPPVS